MSELKSIPLQKFLGSIKQKGYASTRVYTQGNEVKFVQLHSNLQRKPFLLQVPSRFVIYSTETDHILDCTENNYRNFRQRGYLEKIKLRDVACFSKHNLCVKNNNVYSCYLIDNMSQAQEDDLEELDTDQDSPDLSDNDSDIEIDDYPVEDIYPVFSMMSFITDMNNFEDIVLEHYTTITEAEEEKNEDEVEQLLRTFDGQQKTLKDRI